MAIWDRIRMDGWANVFSGIGIKGRDKAVSTTPAHWAPLDQATLDDLYAGDGMGRKIVDAPTENMTREWFTVETEDNDIGAAIMARLDELKAKHAITTMLRWGNLYGGSLAVLGLDDGGELNAPLNEATLRSVNFIQVYDRHEVTFNSTGLYGDPSKPKFGTPEYYTVSPCGGAPFTVHESRTLRIDGDPLPRRLWQSNQYWGASVLQGCYTALRDCGIAHHAAVAIMQEFTISVLKMNNLADLIGSGQEELVTKRLTILDLSKGLNNTALVDEGEEFTRLSASVSGMPDLIDRAVLHLSAVSGIPVTILMGKAPAGLNATGDSDIRNWYDTLSSKQEDKLLPPLNDLVRLLFLAKQGPTSGKEPKDWRVSFRPLWQHSEAEIAATRKVVAESDSLYLDRGVLDPEDVRANRFGVDGYSMETKLEG